MNGRYAMCDCSNADYWFNEIRINIIVCDMYQKDFQ